MTDGADAGNKIQLFQALEEYGVLVKFYTQYSIQGVAVVEEEGAWGGEAIALPEPPVDEL